MKETTTKTTTVNPLESMVSLYSTILESSNGDSTELQVILDGIKEGKWKSKIEKLRLILDAKHRSIYKRKLPNFTASGLFVERKDKSLIQHSEIIVLDLDKIPNITEVKKNIIQDKFTRFCFISCSGNGLAVGVVIDGNQHRESFNQLKSYYQIQFGIEVDKSCVNVSRARFVSYDPELFINDNSEKFEINPALVTPISTPAKQPTKPVANVVQSSDESKYNSCVTITNKKKTYGDGERHSYLLSLAAFCNKVGVSESYALAQMVSDFSVESKGKEEIESVVSHCYSHTQQHNTITLNEFIEVPKINGDEDLKAIYAFVHKLNKDGKKWETKDVTFQSDKYKVAPDVVENIFKFIYKNNADEYGMNNKPLIKRVEHFLNKTYDLRQNIVTQSPQFKKKSEKHYQILNEDSVNRTLSHANIKYPLNQLSSLLKSDFLKEYNPFNEFFENLPKWDRTDHINKLANYITAEYQDFFNIQFKKMLVRSISCSLGDEVNRTVFVLVSEIQEMGKSRFIRHLNPFGEKYYTEAPLRDNKDSEFRTAENFIYNLEELASLRNNDVNSLKAIISKVTVKERRAYAKQEIEAPRRCNFFGSTNKEEFLTDTSNTRWLCFTVNHIDWDYTKEVDMIQVWAQAYTLYKEKFDAELTKEEKAFRESINKHYEVRSHESDWITKYFKVIKKTNKGAEFMTIADIESFITNIEGRPLKMHRAALGRAMTQLGFEKGRKRINGIQARGYWIGIAARGEEKTEAPNALFTDSDIEL